MIMSTLKTAIEYIKQGKFKELIFRGRLFIKYHSGGLRYRLINKINKDKYKIVTVNGSKMYIHLDDDGISKDLYLYKEREKFATECLKSFIKEDDVIIEIGANIGYYVLLENKIAKKGKIFALEPMPFSRKLLTMNVKLNNVENVEIYPFAIGDQNKEQDFYIYKEINISSFNQNLYGNLVSTKKVRIMTLDNFIEKYLGDTLPTVLRMDVEGFEYNVIKGAMNTIRNCNKLRIFMEIHPHILSQEQLNELLNILENNKFEIKTVTNECTPHIYPYLDNKIWDSIEEVPYGCIGNDISYEDLRKYLRINKGSEVFFEKSK
jgi:FkbM family methyltransferase